MAKDSGGSFITGFLVGGIVGVAVGILLASPEDSKARKDMSKKAADFKSKANDFAERFEGNLKPSVEAIKDQVVPMAESVASSVRTFSKSSNGSSESDQSTEKI